MKKTGRRHKNEQQKHFFRDFSREFNKIQLNLHLKTLDILTINSMPIPELLI